MPPADASLRPAPPCHVHKFGGSSLADAALYRSAAALLQDSSSPRVAVVSAMQGVTDALIALVDVARTGGSWREDWNALRARHLAAADALRRNDDSLHKSLDEAFDAFAGQLAALVAGDAAMQASLAGLPGLGEVWSSQLMLAALGGVESGWQRLDARDVLVVHAGEMGMAVDWTESRSRLSAWRASHDGNVVVTGFVARDAKGHATTLGRNGSDYSAAIFANLFDAQALTIWTDVDGVLSADPRLVPEAVCLPSMSYAEACELAYFGAKVLHPQTMAPVQERGIPLWIRNTRKPDLPGTLISPDNDPAGVPVKGLSLVRDLAIVELVGNGMVGVPGSAERMFGALRGAGVSVTMISQGSSEHSICCVLRAEQAERARDAVAHAFADAIADGQAQGVTLTRDIAVLAAVGDGMVGTPGVAARLLGGLAQARVNARAIAQGAGERNISVAIGAADATRALRAAHAAFWLSPQTLSVGVIGPGQVGSALLVQMSAALPELRKRSGLDLRLRAIANSRTMVLDERGFEPADAAARLEGGAAEPVDLDRFADHVRGEHLPHALVVDCSASPTVAAHYPRWLARGIHVVTPNKLAGSGPWPQYAAIQDAGRHGGGRFRYEATVGAGLPVMLTLRNLLDTGDELYGIDGMLSGTLAWLFNRFDGTAPFSQLVREAQALGYTEPDPRDDLSGLDVARKLVILAREAGRALSLEDVDVENLVPEALREVGRDEFLSRLAEMDEPMLARLRDAAAQRRSLRHLAQLDRDGRARVGVVALPAEHACCHTRLTDNLVQFRTRRYADNPLVVQGPGAGPDVTAAGVFGDVLAIAQSLGSTPGLVQPLGADARTEAIA